MYAAVRHFRHILEGRSFIAFTDHRPLVDALHKRSDSWTGRQQRHLSFVSEFNLEIHHVAGKINVTADCLSRASVGTVQSVQLGVDLAELSAAQCTSDDIQAYRTAVTSLQLQDVDFADGISLLCDVSTGSPRPVVPPSFRKQVFDVIHKLSHPGIKGTRRLICQCLS